MERNKLLTGRAKRIGLSLPGPLMDATKAQAKREDRPFAWVVRRALLAYLGADNGQHSKAEVHDG